MTNLIIQNNYRQLGKGSSRVMWYVEVPSYTCFHPLSSLCLLVGAFNPFTFKVIIGMEDLITIFLIWGVHFLQVFPSLVFLAYRSSFSICCKPSFMVMNSLTFFLSGKILTSP